MFSSFTYAPKSAKPAKPPRQRYFIMASTTLPAGAAFAPAESQRQLLTQFAVGMLSVQDVLERLEHPAANQESVSS